MSRYPAIRRILIVTLFLNWLVAAAKIIYGLLTKSMSMSADGFHSLSDGASNIAGLIGIFIASRPVDKFHPYGHKKFETYASIAIAVILFLISFNLLKEAVGRFFNPTLPSVTVFSFGIMVATMAINYFVMTYEKIAGLRFKSDILIADSLHTKSDMLASGSVVFALIATRFGLPQMDLLAGIFISIMIAFCAVRIIKDSTKILCDGLAIDCDNVKNVIKGIPDVKRCHKIRTRGRPDDIHVDLHVSVDTNMHVDKAHAISHKIQDKIKRSIPGVTDVIVHIEPF